MSDEPAETADQRRAERAEVELSVALSVEGQSLHGRTRDLSASGVMFTAEGELRVSVELVRDGRTVRRTGRISRIQRLDASRTAFAVQFDPE